MTSNRPAAVDSMAKKTTACSRRASKEKTVRDFRSNTTATRFGSASEMAILGSLRGSSSSSHVISMRGRRLPSSWQVSNVVER